MLKSSIRNKLVVFLLISIIIPISLSIFITYYYTKDAMKEQYIKENSNLIHLSAISIIDYMKRLNEATLQIYTSLDDPNSLHHLIKNNTNSFLRDRELFRTMQVMSNSVKEIEQIYVYSSVGDISYRYAHRLLRSVEGQSYETPLAQDQHQMDTKQDISVEPLHKSHQYGIAKPKFPFHIEQDVITIHRYINDAPSQDTLGTFSVDVKLDVIRAISEEVFTAPYEDLYIFNEQNKLIFSSQAGLELEDDYTWLQHIRHSTDISGSYHFKDKQFNGIYLYEHLQHDWLDWTIVKRIPYDYLYRDARELTFINSLVLLLFLVIAVIATVTISLRFTNPIKQLLRYINKIEVGNMNADLNLERTDELGILAKRFQQLIQRLNRLITREYRLEIANKTNELKALQAQINPHFLNNALQSIGTLALQQGDKRLYSLISSLGKMMRYQMNTNLTSVPLSAEVDYVKHYLALQQQRFDEQLESTIELDPACKDIHVPKMVLQPIVENYFKHGFQSIVSKSSMGGREGHQSSNIGKLNIRCYLEHDKLLLIEVADNGGGIEPEHMKELQQLLDSKGQQFNTSLQQSEHIGLSNVLARLRLYFDDRAAIQLSTQEPHGLLVTLIIQLDQKGAEHI